MLQPTGESIFDDETYALMIFLHSGFRTSSTYIWSRFRRAQNCIAYYEIFHEILASISQQQIGSMSADAWNSHHPPGAPYFLEFLPLIQEQGGVVGFDPLLSYDQFVPPSGPSGPVSDAEAAYVRMLVDHAEQRGRIPVLTDTRTLGRVAGLKAAVPGLHAIVYRNLFRQWCSYTDQATCGNSGFLHSLPSIVRQSGHDPMIRDLIRMFPVEDASTTDVNTFYLFIFFHIYLYSHATAYADVVIDVDRLCDDISYRADIEEIFIDQNIRVDFSNAHPSTAYSLVTFPCRADMLEQIQIISDAIIGKMPSDRGRAYTTKIVADLIEEFERHEFYSKRLRSVFLSTRSDKDRAIIAAENARRQIADLQSEHDRASVEKDAAIVAVEKARRQAADLENERDCLGGEKDAAVAAAEEARRQTIDMQSERDSARAERDAALAAVEAAHRVTEVLRTERDRLGSEKDEALSAAEEARRQGDALRGERDQAARDQIAIERDCRRLGQDLAALSSLRDRLTSERDAARTAHDDVERQRHLVQDRYNALVHWSVAYHDSTAASASWQLTRPLRWVGLGKPKRPPKPDFL